MQSIAVVSASSSSYTDTAELLMALHRGAQMSGGEVITIPDSATAPPSNPGGGEPGPQGPPGPPGPPGPQGPPGESATRSSTLVNYTYNNTVTEPPAAGQVRMNAVYPFTAVAKLWMRIVSADGQDVYWGLMVIESGMTLLIQDKDNHTLYVRLEAVGVPLDKGLYIEIPVAWVANGGQINTASQVLVQRSGGSSTVLVKSLMARVEALEAQRRE